MNFTEIKAFLLAKKKYVLAVLAVITLAFFFKRNDQQAVDNSQVLGNKTEQRAQLAAKKETGMAKSVNTPAAKTVTVDISGAVKRQGVYTLKNGARIDELIKAAGGLRSNAQIKNINRAVMLKDQDKVHIPYKGEKIANTSVATAGVSNAGGENGQSGDASAVSQDKININTASAADLQKLNGIGEKKAAQIIAYRQEKGQFKKIEDLMQVSGIGEKTFAALKDQLAL